jgi:hypothetical protein
VEMRKEQTKARRMGTKLSEEFRYSVFMSPLFLSRYKQIYVKRSTTPSWASIAWVGLVVPPVPGRGRSFRRAWWWS